MPVSFIALRVLHSRSQTSYSNIPEKYLLWGPLILINNNRVASITLGPEEDGQSQSLCWYHSVIVSG